MNNLKVIEDEFGDLARWNQCPPFWLAKRDLGMPFISSLKQAKVRVIGRSAGNREIIALEYGEKEPLDATTDNLHSAIAAKISNPDPTEIFPPAFYGKTRRKRPVVILQGAIHGGELTGTVASLNLCSIIETGKDLRGKEWPRLATLARQTRIGIVPWINPDATDRWPIPFTPGIPADLYTRCTQGVALDGTKYAYPSMKNIFPMPVDKIAFLGCYYNDAGVNLQYDIFTVERQPETAAWMRYYLDEKPDGVVIFHCNNGSMIGPPSYYLPVGHQITESRLAGAVRHRLQNENLHNSRMSWAGLPGLGKPYMEQMSAVYMVCGALPVMCELPTGGQAVPLTCDQLLDIGLITIEETLAFAHTDGLRPYELWEKVKKSLP